MDSVPKLEALKDELLSELLVGLDYETTARRPRDAAMVGVGLATPDGRSWYLPVGHRETVEQKVPTEQNWKGGKRTINKTVLLPADESPLVAQQLQEAPVRDFLRWLLGDERRTVVAHNAKYELQCTYAWIPDIEIKARVDCTLILDWLVCSAFGVRHGLKAAVEREFNEQMITYDEVTKGKTNKQIAFSSIAETAIYCAHGDARQCLRLYDLLMQRAKQADMLRVYENLELPIMHLLIDMENTGVRIDPKPLEEVHQLVEETKRECEQAAEDLFGEPAPLASPTQLAPFLYEKHGFRAPPNMKAGKSGQKPVSIKVMTWWEKHGNAEEKEFARIRKAWSEAEALRARFTTTLLEVLDDDNRLRGQSNQCGTDTGRFSMSEPNLQNIPSRTKLGLKTREAFVATPGCKLVLADYSQLEPRLMAHFSGDRALVEIYRGGHDIYLFLRDRLVEAGVFGATEDAALIKSQRSKCKVLVLALNYGMAPKTLAANLDIPVEEAEELYRAFFKVCSGVVRWKDEEVARCRLRGYALTLTKRRRYLSDLTAECAEHGASNVYRCDGCWKAMVARERAERQAVNTRIQGSAADVVKLAMRNIDRSFRKNSLKAKILFQVHDEIIVECPEDETTLVSEIMKVEMEAIPLRVPLVTEPIVADCWKEGKE